MINVNTITEEQKYLIIDHSIALIRILCEVTGQAEGAAMWEQMSATMGPEMQGEILMAMVNGKSQCGVTFSISAVNSSTHAVDIIKALRTSTGIGLKEAKDLYDAARSSATFAATPTFADRITLQQNLAHLGVTIHR